MFYVRNRSGTTLVGIAGGCAILFVEVTKDALAKHGLSGQATLMVLVLGTFSVYTLSFQLVDWLHRRYLWRMGSVLDLSGTWRLSLTNLADSTTREGEVHIHQDRDNLRLQGTNYRPPDNTAFSTWSSRLAVMSESTLFVIYEIESSKDEGKNFKRGIIRLQLPNDAARPLVGDFYDNAPSTDRGPASLTRA
jgi:hypothetical protein